MTRSRLIASLFFLFQLKDLHSAGFSLLSIDALGQTALHWSARYGHQDIVKYLLTSSPPALLDMTDNERYAKSFIIFGDVSEWIFVSVSSHQGPDGLT